MSSTAVNKRSSRDAIAENVTFKDREQAYLNEIQKLRNDMEILNQDRRFLNEQNISLKEENTRLQANVIRLEMANDKYKALLQQSNDKLQQKQSDQMAAVQSIRSMTSADQDKEFRTKLGLPDGEFSIISYTCMHEFLTGNLHITPFYICFEGVGILANKESHWSVPIKEILSLNKTRLMKFLPSSFKGTYVEIKTQDGNVRLLKNFLKRKECLRNIYNQSLTIDHTIDMLREGLPDQEHAKPNNTSATTSNQ